jgi:hypothetical protein
MLVAARHRKLLRAARDFGRGLLTLVVAAILILGVLRAGSRYLYCDMTGTIRATSCCEASHHRNGEVAEIEASTGDCCKPRSVGRLPVVVIQTLSAAPSAPVVAVLQSVASAPLKASIQREAFRAKLTGPPLRSPSDPRARLMVFLI